MKTIRVVAAVIKKGDKIFSTQRGYGDFKGGWEFPGGKIEQGETPEEAIVREIKEELDASIVVDRYMTTIEYDYPNFHLSMDCFLAHLKEDHVELLEHSAAKWLTREDIDTVQWLPADITIIDMVKADILA